MMNLVVALKAEARPLIRHYKLHSKHADSTFPIYLGADMALVISGPGKVAAAAAALHLQETISSQRRRAWLNIGIAGHPSHAPGDARIVNRITDFTTNRRWYPPQVHGIECVTGSLLTVDSPENDYAVDTLYDMEAAGFYPAACRFSTSELVQCFKIVSDNRQHANTKITAKHCEQLVENQMNIIDKLVETLGNMQKQYRSWHTPHPDLDRLLGQWHFTVTQHHQLARLLERWSALKQGQTAYSRELEKKNTAADVLRCLEQQLNTRL